MKFIQRINVSYEPISCPLAWSLSVRLSTSWLPNWYGYATTESESWSSNNYNSDNWNNSWFSSWSWQLSR